MEQSETAARAVAAAPVVRQLDFTVNFKATANLILPEHPQAQLESKLLALAQPKQVHADARSQSPPLTVSQIKLPPRKMVMPPKSSHRGLPQTAGQAKSLAIAPQFAYPVKQASTPKPALKPLLKMESPKSRDRCNLEQNNGTPKKQKHCNCKNSRCLKLYCDCFASGSYCDGCNCTNCHNKVEYEADRKECIDSILERNPDAFKPKITSSPHGAANGGVEHNRGCNCKKSGCLKKYCDCFQANIMCSDKCKCMDCKNYEGSEEMKAHCNKNPANSMAFIQQAVNAAINGAIGTPSKKFRNQQIVFGTAFNKQSCSWLPKLPQETCSTSDASYYPLPVYMSKRDGAKLELPKASYRSPLTGILQSQHVKDFCTLLVETSTEAAQSLSVKRKWINNSKDMNETENAAASCHEHSKGNQNQSNSMESCGDQENRDKVLFSESDGSNIQTGRPLSPATLALMCDERDKTFMAANAPSTVTESNNTRTNMNPKSTHGLDHLDVEQEKLVLTRFCSFLNRLITCGSIEETKIEPEAN